MYDPIVREYEDMFTREWIDNSTRYTTINSPMIYGKMNQSMLMDLWNNQVGRELANNKVFKAMSYEQLFSMAVENNYLITDASQVYEKLGITEYINSDDWTVNVEWNLDAGDITFIKDKQRIT